MSDLNQTPSANRIHVGFFGRRNAGKSSLINAISGQTLSIVSPIAGTTTDPVQKSMELLPLGPIVLIDTPGIDDDGELGSQRVDRAYAMMNRCDLAVLVVDGTVGLTDEDNALAARLKKKDVPFLVVFNKADADITKEVPEDAIEVSAKTGSGIEHLKNMIGSLHKQQNEKRMVGDLLTSGDHVILVTPIDESAPKGRMILPQVQTIRDILDSGCTCSVTQPEQLPDLLASFKREPKMVITDSQAFHNVKAMVKEDILLTSFSILMARYKGFLKTAVQGVAAARQLKDGDTVLISEGCTHHRQCKDIGTVKLPEWIQVYTGRNLNFEFTSGGGFPDSLSNIQLVVHCGGCMLNEREMTARWKQAEDQNVPFTNYGILIAEMNGILKRSIEVFPDIAKLV